MATFTPPNGLTALTSVADEMTSETTKMPLTPPSSGDISLSSETIVSAPRSPTKPKSSTVAVNLVKTVEHKVTYSEIIWFALWGIAIILAQLWEDIKSGRIYKPVLHTDFVTHYFSIPALRQSPRLVTSGPYNRMTIKTNVIANTGAFDETELINCASNNYGGFTELEPGMVECIEAGLRSLPFCPPPKSLEDLVHDDIKRYMDFDGACMAPSGFSTNILAFTTVAGVAARQLRHLVFLMDNDCHNSMFTGAFHCKEAKVQKFRHNDFGDLEHKLRMYREQDPLAFICVAIEGVYSMDGSVSFGPMIVALKRIHSFTLLVDEAHSFLAMGAVGKGSFNHWQDAGYDCPLKAVDVMSVMFSKSVGCTGGCVLANGLLFANELHWQSQKLEENRVEKLSTPILLRIVGLLRKPMLIQHNMRLLRKKTTFVASELRRAGCGILGSEGSAIVCMPVGTMRQVALFHEEAVKVGIAIVGAGPPATPIWGCRVRICIFATTTWPDIHKLLTDTIRICRYIRVRGVSHIEVDERILNRNDEDDELVNNESEAMNSQTLQLIESLAKISHPQIDTVGNNKETSEAAVQGLRRYGIGPCSARWFYGSFNSFISLEERLANLYPSLVAQSGGCQAMICGDAEVTLSSTVTALSVRPASMKRYNTIFIPINVPKGIFKGADFHKANRFVHRIHYDDISDMEAVISNITRPTHMTFYFLTCSPKGDFILDMASFFGGAAFRNLKHITGMTIMLDDRYGLGRIGPSMLGYLDHMEAMGGSDCLGNVFHSLRRSKRGGIEVRVIVAGSWYEAFGHQGGYVVGHRDTVEALTWDAKAYFFSTPPMPLQAVMTEKAIEQLQRARDARAPSKDIESL